MNWVLVAGATARGGPRVIRSVPTFDPNWMNAGTGRLPVFRNAVAKTLAGNADTIVSIAGDSTTQGFDASSFSTTYPSVLASLLTVAGYPAQAESRFGPVVTGATAGTGDAQLSIGSGWASAGVQSIQFWTNSTSTNALVFTTLTTITGFDIYYFDGASGTFQVTVDGSTVDTITLGNTGVMVKKTYTTSSGTHALGVVRTAGSVSFMGWTLRNSAAKQIIIHNLGVSGSKSGDWSPGGGTNPQAVLALTAAHLIIINLGINDWDNGIPPATYLSNMQSLRAAVSPPSDVLWMYPVPTVTSQASIATQQAIGAQIYFMASSHNDIGLDMTKRWVSQANSAALYNADGVHPNDSGYADEAAALSALLQFCAQY